jgi:hypothetical protein
MRGVGAFYVLLALLNLPPLVAARLPRQYPGMHVAADSGAGRAIVDLWGLVGAELGVLGVLLIVGARQAAQHRSLAAAVLWLEAIRGVGLDLYWAASGRYDAGFYLAFAVVHAVIIGTGWWALRRMPPPGPAHPQGL